VGFGDPVSTDHLRSEFVLALRAGASHTDLLAIVSRHKVCGVNQQATYDTLESIRIELGCDKDETEGNSMCERIEDIMDRVWGFCAPADAIWNSSLSE